MSHLNDESRALVDAARDGDEPSVEDRMRVRRRLLQLGVVASVTTVASATAAAASGAGGAGVGAGAGSVATGAAASMAPAPLAAGGAVVLGPGVVSSFGAIAVKIVVGVALLGSVGAVGVKGVSTYRAHQAQTETKVVTVSHAAAPAPVPAREAPAVNALPAMPDTPPSQPALPPVAEVLAAEPPPTVAAEPVHTRSTKRAAVTAEPPSTTELESRLLGDAERARQGGNPTYALRLLDEHNARFPYGVLVAEEEAARILTLCDLGRGAEAKANARVFLAEYPRHPSAEKVRASCARLSQP